MRTLLSSIGLFINEAILFDKTPISIWNILHPAKQRGLVKWHASSMKKFILQTLSYLDFSTIQQQHTSPFFRGHYSIDPWRYGLQLRLNGLATIPFLINRRVTTAKGKRDASESTAYESLKVSRNRKVLTLIEHKLWKYVFLSLPPSINHIWINARLTFCFM